MTVRDDLEWRWFRPYNHPTQHTVLPEAYQLIRNPKRVALSRKAKRKLLEPGYWGSLEDEELEIIQSALQNNPKLSFAWGFQPVQKSRAPDAIRRVAMWGDPKDREVNTRVIRSGRMRVS